ncbi:MAG: cytochrome c1 [Gammaproteobacteria bacterium]|nr:cytochrome c1 [Gammaproteobacteria bacterium]
MKRTVFLICLLLAPLAATAAGGNGQLDEVKIDLRDKQALQRGARLFVNFCLSCHSAGYMRYDRMGKDLGIPEAVLKDNFLFSAHRPGDLMKATMPHDDAKLWFGTAPPDLSLVARSRGPEWFYTYMRSFYQDEVSPSGWNNRVFPHVAMPHVLYEWQGTQQAIFHKDEHGQQHFERFELTKAGSMSPEEYDAAMHDLTNFMVYLGEPAKLHRYNIGVFVLIFMAIFTLLMYALKKEYWTDVK